MLIARVVVGLLLLAAVICFAAYAGSGQKRWLQRGWVLVKWTLMAGLGFFAVLILQRLARLL
jgi:uncharacterized membrane protein